MTKRTIEGRAKFGNPHFVGDGFRVSNFIPSVAPMHRMSPFIMLDYNAPYHFPPSEIPKGVGVHPHKGFETVTIAYKGKVQHGDSAGGGGVISEGDVQWMTAGAGILHKEFHEEAWSRDGGLFQMVQLWVNLPAKDKNVAPKYQSIMHASMPVVQLAENSGLVEVIAGNYADVQGGASTFTPIHLLNAKLNKSGNAHFSFPINYNTAILVIEGSITVNENEIIHADEFVYFKNDGTDFSVSANEEAVVLILSGEPINEPIATYGPFVMNTQAEIQAAIKDYNLGKFGYLED
jgi:redox-sensitive bicupin YhaK (pirin superfamily)